VSYFDDSIFTILFSHKDPVFPHSYSALRNSCFHLLLVNNSGRVFELLNGRYNPVPDLIIQLFQLLFCGGEYLILTLKISTIKKWLKF